MTEVWKMSDVALFYFVCFFLSQFGIGGSLEFLSLQQVRWKPSTCWTGICQWYIILNLMWHFNGNLHLRDSVGLSSSHLRCHVPSVRSEGSTCDNAILSPCCLHLMVAVILFSDLNWIRTFLFPVNLLHLCFLFCFYISLVRQYVIFMGLPRKILAMW